MSEAIVEYVENPEPFQLAGSTHWLLGAYRVEIGSFRYLAPHTGTPATVGAWPLEHDEAFRRMLIEDAEKARDLMTAEAP